MLIKYAQNKSNAKNRMERLNDTMHMTNGNKAPAFYIIDGQLCHTA